MTGEHIEMTAQGGAQDGTNLEDQRPAPERRWWHIRLVAGCVLKAAIAAALWFYLAFELPGDKPAWLLPSMLVFIADVTVAWHFCNPTDLPMIRRLSDAELLDRWKTMCRFILVCDLLGVVHAVICCLVDWLLRDRAWAPWVEVWQSLAVLYACLDVIRLGCVSDMLDSVKEDNIGQRS